MSYQTGWIKEVQRNGWMAFKLNWREKDGSRWVMKSKTLPREIKGKETVRKDAQQELDRILQEVNRRDGVARTGLEVSFKQLLEDKWADYVERNKLRLSTLDGYKSIIDQWIEPHFGKMSVTKITKDHVSTFFKTLRKEGLSDKYQKNIYSLLVKIFDVAVAFDVIEFSPVNPTLHRPHVFRKEKTVMPVEKLQAFFEAIPENWKAVVSVLLLTAMRQGELLGLRWTDIDFVSKKIFLRNVVYRGQLVVGLKDTKREGNRSREIAMVPEIERILIIHRERSEFTTPDAYVFCREDGRPLDPDHMRRSVLYPAMEAAGVEMQDYSNGLHMFRHTALSELAKRKGLKAAQHQAGHSSMLTTANIYTHVDSDQQFDSASALRDAFAAHLLPAATSSSVN